MSTRWGRLGAQSVHLTQNRLGRFRFFRLSYSFGVSACTTRGGGLQEHVRLEGLGTDETREAAGSGGGWGVGGRLDSTEHRIHLVICLAYEISGNR